MIPLLLLALAAQTAKPAGPPAPAPDVGMEKRYDACVALADSDPAKAEAAAAGWLAEDGGFFARQCQGIAYASEARWSDAATAFETAAHGAEAAHDARAAHYWAQAGNAWLAGGKLAPARAALDAALAGNTMTGLQLGEAHLDRARVLVAAGQAAAAREDIDAALASVPDDPLAWLLSATLARRTGDLSRARHDIDEALDRASDDSSVHLEAGNIAAKAGDEAGAKAEWGKAVSTQPTSPAAQQARDALTQFAPGGGG